MNSAPACRIEVDGQVVSSEVYGRMTRCEVTDNDGAESDSVELELNDWPCAAIPRKGAIIKVWMGYQGAALAYMGSFTAETVEVQVLPYLMSISGKAADLRSAAKAQTERHWDDAPIKKIVEDVAKDMGLKAKVAGAVSDFAYRYLAQQNESPMHFLERLASRHDAVFSVKDGTVIFVERAAGLNASGAALTWILITPQIMLPARTRIRFSDRSQSEKVKASYTDPDKAEKKDVEEDSDPDGSSTDRLPEQYADEKEAKVAAKSRAKQLKRREVTFETEIVGDPSARAGAPLTFAVNRPGVDGLPFIVKTARHRQDKGGYTTSLGGESKDGQSARS